MVFFSKRLDEILLEDKLGPGRVGKGTNPHQCHLSGVISFQDFCPFCMEKISLFNSKKQERKWQLCNIRILQPESKLRANVMDSIGLLVICNMYVLVFT